MKQSASAVGTGSGAGWMKATQVCKLSLVLTIMRRNSFLFLLYSKANIKKDT